MKKTSLFSVVVCVGLMMFFACEHKYQGKLTPIFDNSTGKWGYVDTLGKIVLAPQWDMAEDFSEGLASVGLNNLFGYIDDHGIEVIPIKYNSTGSFFNNMALVSLIDKWGFIDKKGMEIIPIKYDKAIPFSEGVSEVELDGKIGSIDTTGTIIVPFQNIGIEADEPYEVINEFFNRFSNGTDYMSLCSVDLDETKILKTLEFIQSFGHNISVLYFDKVSEEILSENDTKYTCLFINNSGKPVGLHEVVLAYFPERNKYLIKHF